MSEENAAPEPPSRVSVGGAPIPGDSPAGVSVRDDARFAEMRQEIDLLVSIRADAAEPDWRKIVTLGEELLTTLGKDISVASWLAVARLHLEGAEGLRGGAAVMADLCAEYWDALFPPVARMRARMGAIDWWQDQVDAWLEKQKPEFLPADLQADVAAALRRLEESVAAHVPDHSLRLYALAARLNQIPAPPESAPTSAAEKNKASPASSPAVVPIVMPTNLDITNAAFASDCARFCLDAAEAQLRGDLTHPASYVLRRVALWGFLRDLPPTEDGRTLLIAPEDHILPGLTALLAAHEYEKVVRDAESCANAHIYWLTLNRFSAQALAGLGETHTAAKRALEGQVAGLLLRFPELPQFCFADGAPFADAATLTWLSTLSGSGAPSDPFSDAIAKAEAATPSVALEMLGDLLLQYPGGKETLRLYRSIFEVCRKGELWPPLPFLAQRLITLSATHKLPAYDSVAVARTFTAAAAALAALLSANPENAEARTQYAAISVELAGLQPHRLLS
jgi:type VI secretion system protein VasJ